MNIPVHKCGVGTGSYTTSVSVGFLSTAVRRVAN